MSEVNELRLSHSKRGRYRKCPRYYNLHDVKKVRSKERSIFFIVGSLFHKGVQQWHQGMDFDIDAALIEDIGKPLSMVDVQTLQKLEIEKAKIKGMLEGYKRRYKTDDSTYKRIVCEQEAKIPIEVDKKLLDATEFSHVTYFGYLDCLMQDKNGDWWIKETKTTSDSSEDFITQAKLNFQLFGYMFLARSLVGKWPKGVIFDVVKKTQIRQKQNESISAFMRRCVEYYLDDTKDMYRRSEIRVDKRELSLWKRETRYEAEDILASHARDYFPMNNEQCKGKYGLCPLFQVCSTGKVSRLLFDVKKS